MRFENPGLITLDETATGPRPKFIVHFLKPVDPNNPDTTEYLPKEHTRTETFSYKDGRGYYLREQLADRQVKMGYFEISEKYGLQLKSIVTQDDRLISARDYFDGHEELPRPGETPQSPAPSVPENEEQSQPGQSKLMLEDLEQNPGTGIWSYTLNGERSSIEDPEMNQVVSDLDERFRSNRLLQEKADNPPKLYAEADTDEPTVLGAAAAMVPMPKGSGMIWAGLAAAALVVRLLAILAILTKRLFSAQFRRTPQSAVLNPTANKEPLTKNFLNQEEAVELENVPHIGRLEISNRGIDADFVDFQGAPMLQDKETRELAERLMDYLSETHEGVDRFHIAEDIAEEERPSAPTYPGKDELLANLNGKSYAPEVPSKAPEVVGADPVQEREPEVPVFTEAAEFKPGSAMDFEETDIPEGVPVAANEDELLEMAAESYGEEVEDIIDIPTDLLKEDQEPLVPEPQEETPAEEELFNAVDFDEHQRNLDRIENPLGALRDFGIRSRPVEGKDASLLAYAVRKDILPATPEEKDKLFEELAVRAAESLEEVDVVAVSEFSEDRLPNEKGTIVLMPPKEGNGVFAYQFELNEDLSSLTYQKELTGKAGGLQAALAEQTVDKKVSEEPAAGPYEDVPPEEEIHADEKEQYAGMGIDM